MTAALLALSLAAPAPTGVDAAAAERFANLALACVHKEYPNKIAHVLQGDTDVKPPRDLTPAFYGCYDWHSAVHGHWLLTRLARLYPDQPFAREARKALTRSLTAPHIAAEVAYLEGPGRASFERPYGLAWLLQLAAELRSWPDDAARGWSSALEPLEKAAVRRLADWLPKLRYPIRIGEHDQTAFAFGLAWDWTQTAKDTAVTSLLESRIRDFYLAIAIARCLTSPRARTSCPPAWLRPICFVASCPRSASGNGSRRSFLTFLAAAPEGGWPRPKSQTAPTPSWPTSTA